jgi:hypothetical protein
MLENNCPRLQRAGSADWQSAVSPIANRRRPNF